MDSFRIASTTTAGLRPLGASGQRSHALVDTLGRHLSEAHAKLFAEPVPTPDGERIDWYAAFEGEAAPLERADPASRERAQAELGRLAADIEQLADRLEHSTSAEDKQRAAALRHALRYPDDGYIWIVDGHPVVTAWAHVHEDVDRPGSNLSAWIRRAPRPRPGPAAVTAAPVPGPAGPAAPTAATTTILSAPAPPAVVDQKRPSWLGLLLWLLLLALLVAIALRLLPACGVGFPGRATLEAAGILDRCPGALAAAPRNDLEREALRQDVLESEIDRLRRDLALRQNECRSQAARERGGDGSGSGDVSQGGDEVPSDEFDERVEREGGETGAMTISLLWQGPSDLDLMVHCPSGELIDYNRPGGCGGRLQIDMNSNVNTMSDTPIEHVVWPDGNVQPGAYQVQVKLYALRDGVGPIPFQVRTTVGDREQIFDGSVTSNGEVVDVTTVQMP